MNWIKVDNEYINLDAIAWVEDKRFEHGMVLFGSEIRGEGAAWSFEGARADQFMERLTREHYTAHLQDAAPDLLQACEALLAVLARYNTEEDTEAALAMCDAEWIIAKAKGVQP